MEKIKSVLSHGTGKEDAQGRYDSPTTAEFDRSNTGGLTGEGSHLAGTQQSQGASGEYHPIYDQFAKGDSIKSTDHASQSPNAPNVPQTTGGVMGDTSAPSATSSLHPDQGRPAPTEKMSNASIKSGVIGFPQDSHDSHPALSNNTPLERSQHEGNQSVVGQNLPGTKSSEQRSHVGKDAAVGAGALGASALSGRGLQYRTVGTDTGTPNRAPQINIQRQESDVQESGRSFPLMGGVQNRQTTTTTSEREPGTKEKKADVHDGHGREALAEAAAAAAASASGDPQGEGSTGATTQPRYDQDAITASNSEIATAAGWSSHDHHGHGHDYKGDPCEPESPESPKSNLLFTSGPHQTDTANRTDPHLHIPGEFPSPTPVEESNAPSYLQSKPITAMNPSALAESELRHTGTLEDPEPRSARSSPEHHKGRDAAIAGGLGAAGAGAYAAGKHQRESLDTGSETFPSEPNPYTSSRVDPRVDIIPRGGFADQRYDPTSSENRTARNAALTGGAIGSSQPSQSTQPASHGRALENKEYPAASQGVKSDTQHQYGRDAALVGAGAATTAGLYASQRAAEPDSGPASSTIGPHKSNVANVLDPRVQPDPDVQKHHYAAPTVEDPAPSTVGPHKSDVANVLDPRVLPDSQKQKGVSKEEVSRGDQHHYGRDAAVAGGAGAAGYGAYEAVKAYEDHPSTQAVASMNEQRYDPVASTHQVRTPQNQHHYGRDAAAVGGVGALGAGAYAASRPHDQPSPSTAQTFEQQYQHASSPRDYTPAETGTHQGYDSKQNPEDPSKDHSARNAALGAAAGAGAVGAGAYGLSQADAKKEHERQLKEQQKAYSDQQRSLEKQQAKEHKQHDKLVAAEEKKHQKDVEHQEHQHAKEMEKQQEKQQKEHERVLAAQQAQQEQELQRREKSPQGEGSEDGSPKEKKHRFLTFLNKRDKDKSSSGENSPRGSRDSPRQSRDYAAGVGAAGVAGVVGADEGRHLGEKKGRHVLHKDPPEGHSARQSLEQSQYSPTAGKREHFGTDGPIGDPNFISGNRVGDVPGGHHTVTEPHTGLPMDVGRYGDGKGGTDASATVPGQHDVPGGAGTNWEEVKKKDTLF